MNRLLFIVNVDWFFMSHRLPIALEALKNGYEVHLACKYTKHKDELEKLGIKCYPVSFSRSGASVLNELVTLLDIRQTINIVKPDIVHAVTIKPVIYTGLALQTVRIRVGFVAAISGLGYVFTAKTLRARFTKFLVSLFYRLSFRVRGKIVIFQNSADKECLKSIVELGNKEITLIKGSGVDLGVYKSIDEPKGEKKVISMACRLLREKGVYQFAEAARYVKSRIPEVEFRLIGSIDNENPNSITQEELDNWVKEGIILHLGHREDIPSLFSESHIITLPSFYGEGVPKVLIEAAACGRAIITTDNPGCREAIVEGETGLSVPVKDSEALAKSILYLLENDELRIEMGLNARQYAIKEFDVKNVVKKHLDIYSSMKAEK
ncbi:glycosyltransferase family 4 protein [Vibrio diabolicus]|uniref:glycosyltransferase family 4 protein n=1 Tax=Vibrio diabolicus TaxID=50719 RepID=UPI0037520DAF